MRPIVRVKREKIQWFGAQISVSCIDGYIFLHRISWDNYKESQDLKAQVEEWKNYTGYYPEWVYRD